MPSSDGDIDRLTNDYAKIHLIHSKSNLGFAGGCNLGAQAARGEILVFLNPDNVVVPGWLEEMNRKLAENQGVGLVTPKILLFSPAGYPECGRENYPYQRSYLMPQRRQVQGLRRRQDREILRCHTYRLDFAQTAKRRIAQLAQWFIDPLFVFGQLALIMIRW